MGSLDILVLAALAVMAAWPWIATRITHLFTPRPASVTAVVPLGSSTEEWRQAWASTLIRLIDEIETGDGHFEDEKVALRLSKELLWEIIGGDGPMPSKSK